MINREEINEAIKNKYGEDPQDRFRIIRVFESGVIECQVQWEENDLEILSIKL